MALPTAHYGAFTALSVTLRNIGVPVVPVRSTEPRDSVKIGKLKIQNVFCNRF